MDHRVLKAVRFIDAAHYAVPAGKEQAIGPDSGPSASRAYNLSLSVGDAKNGCHGSMLVEAFAGNATVNVPSGSQGKVWFTTAISLKFTAIDCRIRITFYSSCYHTSVSDPGRFVGPVLDQVRDFLVKA